jgi:hypothetical protein
MIPPRFESIWREIVNFDSKPTDQIGVDDESAPLKIERSLERFINGRPVLVDSPGFADRPRSFQASSAAEILRTAEAGREFVVLIADESVYWAILEEEYEWLIFEQPGDGVQPG